MTFKRAAAYIGGASLLGAWLSSAAGLSTQFQAGPEQPNPVKTSGTETLAADVQAQAARLRERMASAPAPQEPVRNPFAFAVREVPRQRQAAPSPSPILSPAPRASVVEPMLELIGVAEQQSEKGPVRTAMIVAESGELFMLKAGELLGATYRVKAIGAEAVELTDVATGAIRRLALR
jgi:hypothetical protein